MKNRNVQLEKFGSEPRSFLQFRYSQSLQQDAAKRFNETEKAAFSFIDGYLLNSPDLIAVDVEHTVRHILNEFMESKVK